MEHILLPSTIDFQEGEKGKNFAQIIIKPCQQGYGTTLGNSLRRVLLSSLPGSAVESVRIHGVSHEFSAIEGVKEDMIQIIMNLKEMAVKCHADESVKLTLNKKGKGVIKASDFATNADVDIINSDLEILTVTDDKKNLEMEITVGNGSGFVPVSAKDGKNLDLGTILIDSLYTPIVDIGYRVNMTRVGDVTDYEELKLNIETDGSVSPKVALNQSVKLLMDHYSLILDATNIDEEEKPKKSKK